MKLHQSAIKFRKSFYIERSTPYSKLIAGFEPNVLIGITPEDLGCLYIANALAVTTGFRRQSQ